MRSCIHLQGRRLEQRRKIMRDLSCVEGPWKRVFSIKCYFDCQCVTNLRFKKRKIFLLCKRMTDMRSRVAMCTLCHHLPPCKSSCYVVSLFQRDVLNLNGILIVFVTDQQANIGTCGLACEVFWAHVRFEFFVYA